MNRLRTKLTVTLAFLLCLQPLLASAQETVSFPGIPLNSKTLRVQEQADEVYERTDYKRAFFIYRHELAPIGDKYGQYMVGYMYLTGKGVAEDRVAASAWYRLAAERHIKEFVTATDRLMAQLAASEKARSDELFLQLRKEYGDLSLLMRELRKDYETLRARTGSRLSSGSSPMLVVAPNGSAQSGSNYYGRVQKRIQSRLDYIANHTEIEIIDTDIEEVDLESIESQVSAHLNALN